MALYSSSRVVLCVFAVAVAAWLSHPSLTEAKFTHLAQTLSSQANEANADVRFAERLSGNGNGENSKAENSKAENSKAENSKVESSDESSQVEALEKPKSTLTEKSISEDIQNYFQELLRKNYDSYFGATKTGKCPIPDLCTGCYFWIVASPQNLILKLRDESTDWIVMEVNFDKAAMHVSGSKGSPLGFEKSFNVMMGVWNYVKGKPEAVKYLDFHDQVTVSCKGKDKEMVSISASAISLLRNGYTLYESPEYNGNGEIIPAAFATFKHSDNDKGLHVTIDKEKKKTYCAERKALDEMARQPIGEVLKDKEIGNSLKSLVDAVGKHTEITTVRDLFESIKIGQGRTPPDICDATKAVLTALKDVKFPNSKPFQDKYLASTKLVQDGTNWDTISYGIFKKSKVSADKTQFFCSETPTKGNPNPARALTRSKSVPLPTEEGNPKPSLKRSSTSKTL